MVQRYICPSLIRTTRRTFSKSLIKQPWLESTLIAENHLIPYFGKRKIGSITEADIQSYISYLYNAGRLDKTGGLTVKTIRDVILVLRLSMEYAYKERANVI